MGTGSHRDKDRSGWSPLRYSDFRRWWLAQLTSNVGSWMQTVAAQWVMTTLTSSAFLVGAIQGTNLPVLLLAVPGGVLGDLLNRKKLIIAGQAVMSPPGTEEAFLAYSDRLRHFRQRTGGMQWRLFVHEQKPGRYLETFLVSSWEEHERQHGRATQHDANLLEQLDGLLVPGTHRQGHHYLTAQPPPHRRV